MPNEESLHDQVIVDFLFMVFLFKLIVVFSAREAVFPFGSVLEQYANSSHLWTVTKVLKQKP